MAKESMYSAKNVVSFINDNFGIMFISLLFFLGGFFLGSLWTENQLLKNGLGGGQQVADTGGAQQEVNKLTRENFVAYASDLKVDKKKFEQCIDNKETQQEIVDEMDKGSAAGVNSTPTTIVYVNGTPKEVISGAASAAQLKTIIDKHLADPSLASSMATSTVDPSLLPAIGGDDHIRGNKNATVALVEYSDYQCPYCKSFHPSLVQVLNDYKDKIAWVYRDYPLTSIHPNAMPAAIAAECVAQLKDENAFWEYSDVLFE